MAKLQKVYKRGTVIKLPISKQIDVNFRDYAIYVLENRGIPSFYDGLTNVQKFILQNTPTKYTKTVTVIGKCIEDSYHHGDTSLGGAINKLARPYGNGESLLNGSGFFGNAISNDAAAARYTSVKLNSEVAELIKKNNFLNTKNLDDQWNPLWLDLPIGLTTSIIGIAVGYATTILPRPIADIKKYLNGEIKEIPPRYNNFNGKISRFNKLDKSWLIEGVTKINKNNKTIIVTELPPVLKYSTWLRKIDKIVSRYENFVDIKNKTRDAIEIIFTFKSKDPTIFKSFCLDIENSTKIIVTENPVFIKDGVVLVYKKIEDYLDDYQYRIAELSMRRSEYYFNQTSNELEFQIAKMKYLNYMIKQKRTDSDVLKFISKFNKKIINRLDLLSLRKLTDDEIKRTDLKIKELTKQKTSEEKLYIKYTNKFNKMLDPTIKRGVKSKKSNIDLFNDSDLGEYDGIEIFKADGELNELTEDYENDNDN